MVASVGVAPNKFVAKLAGDIEKPDGFVVVQADQLHDFLDPLPVGRLWGVGKVMEQRMLAAGFQTIAQVRHTSIEELQSQFGKLGDHVWHLANGLDKRRVETEHQAKSVSHETDLSYRRSRPGTAASVFNATV